MIKKYLFKVRDEMALSHRNYLILGDVFLGVLYLPIFIAEVLWRATFGIRIATRDNHGNT